MQLRPTIDKAGRFPVVQTPAPFQHGFLANLNAPPSGILHTTEGGWAGSMAVFKVHYAPHFLVGLNGEGRVEIAQLVPVGYGALACKEHNNGARVEIETVAFSKETPWLPDAETLDALASLMAVCRDEWGIPLSRPWADGDYGRAGHNPHRSSGKFGTVPGWFGHGDMPDKDTHWDPGNLRWSVLLARANDLVPAASPGPPQQVTAPIGSLNGSPTVSWLQTSLNRLGTLPPLVVDGDLGPKTRQALTRFQVTHGLAGTGQMSDMTVAALQKALQG